MKKISTLFFFYLSFTFLLIPKAFAGDGVYDVYVIGYNTSYDTFMTNLGGRAGYEYLKAMGQNSGGSNNSYSGSSTSTPPPNKCNTIEVDFAQCQTDAQKLRLEHSSACTYRTYGGIVAGAVIAGGAAWLTGGASLLVYSSTILGGASGGGALGAYSSSSCIADADNTLATNLAICNSNMAKTKNACGK